MQKALVPYLPNFLAHTEARLVATDISPTECITAVYKDNRIVCTQVGEDMVRHFVRLAATEHAPRYLRFLRMITVPNAIPNKRNQVQTASLVHADSVEQCFIRHCKFAMWSASHRRNGVTWQQNRLHIAA